MNDNLHLPRYAEVSKIRTEEGVLVLCRYQELLPVLARLAELEEQQAELEAKFNPQKIKKR